MIPEPSQMNKPEVVLVGVRFGKVAFRVRGLPPNAMIEAAFVLTDIHPEHGYDAAISRMPSLAPASDIIVVDLPPPGHFVYVRVVSVPHLDVVLTWESPHGQGERSGGAEQ